MRKLSRAEQSQTALLLVRRKTEIAPDTSLYFPALSLSLSDFREQFYLQTFSQHSIDPHSILTLTIIYVRESVRCLLSSLQLLIIN